ncbi:MAG TPA: hypothetical protein VLE02_00940 [Nitrosarchaeum sp.]|nr:hypothetical protein [Nitrosarchaeum sp.]
MDARTDKIKKERHSTCLKEYDAPLRSLFIKIGVESESEDLVPFAALLSSLLQSLPVGIDGQPNACLSL